MAHRTPGRCGTHVQMNSSKILASSSSTRRAVPRHDPAGEGPSTQRAVDQSQVTSPWSTSGDALSLSPATSGDVARLPAALQLPAAATVASPGRHALTSRIFGAILALAASAPAGMAAIPASAFAQQAQTLSHSTAASRELLAPSPVALMLAKALDERSRPGCKTPFPVPVEKMQRPSVAQPGDRAREIDYALLHGDYALAALEFPALNESPAPASYPPIEVEKGDYVANGVDYSRLVTDEEFVDASSLSTEQIQTLLEHNGSFLARFAEDGHTAAQIIHDAATRESINPRIVLATLEKENGLVSRHSQAPSWMMRSAMGYAYDDRGGTAGRHSTFTSQVEKGTRLLRSLYDEGSTHKMPVRMRVDYNHRTIRVDNAATYALMKYTPHTRDIHLHVVGGGNHLFKTAIRRVNAQAEKIVAEDNDTM